jgi:hypothetical protein
MFEDAITMAVKGTLLYGTQYSLVDHNGTSARSYSIKLLNTNIKATEALGGTEESLGHIIYL